MFVCSIYFIFLFLEVFDTSLTWQFRIAIGKMGLSKNYVCKSVYDSINAAYISDEEKASLRKLVDDYISLYDTI